MVPVRCFRFYRTFSRLLRSLSFAVTRSFVTFFVAFVLRVWLLPLRCVDVLVVCTFAHVYCVPTHVRCSFVRSHVVVPFTFTHVRSFGLFTLLLFTFVCCGYSLLFVTLHRLRF
jgi:hypothetical protein